jgi:hypothetical protein
MNEGRTIVSQLMDFRAPRKIGFTISLDLVARCQRHKNRRILRDA